MIELAASAAQTVNDVVVSNPNSLPEAFRVMREEVSPFHRLVSDAARLDTQGERGAGRIAKPLAVAAAMTSELTIGNEAAVVLAGTTFIHEVTPLNLSGNPVLDVIVIGSSAAAATYGFSYWQQRAYGGVTRWGLGRYPTAVKTASLLAGSREEHMNDNYKSDGNAALFLGTSLAFLRHKVRNPNSPEEAETNVIKRGARAIAGFWAGVIGASAVIAKGTQNADSVPLIQGIENLTSLPNLALVAGVAYTGYEWFKLLTSNSTEVANNIADKDEPTRSS